MRCSTAIAAFFAIGLACSALAAETPSVEQLSGTLASGDSAAQAAAADQLAAYGAAAKPAVKALAKAIESNDPQVQWHAARALSAIGPGAADAVPALTKALKSNDKLVRAHAANALGHIGQASKPSAQQIAELVSDTDPDVRRAAVTALKTVRPEPGVMVPVMKRVLEQGDQDPSVAILAMEALRESGEPGMQALTEALQNDQARYWAILALGKLGSQAKPAVPALAKLASHSDPEIRMQAMIALGEIGPDAKPALPEITKALNDPQNAVRYGAAFALGQIGAAEASNELEKQLDNQDDFLKMVTAWALAKINPNDNAANERAIKLLVASLKDDDRQIRAAAARGLQELKPARRGVVVEELVKLLDDKDPVVRANVADALASLGESSLPRLVNGLQDDKLQSLAIEVIQNLGPRAKGIVPQIVEELKDPDANHRREAVFALAAIGPEAKEAVPALVAALNDSDEHVRHTACYALGKIGPGAVEACPPLRQNLTSDDQLLKVASVWALLRINPEDMKLKAMAAPLFAKALEESDRDRVRIELAQALGDIGPPAGAAVPTLQKFADSAESPELRAAATEAIKKIQTQ